MTDERTPTMDDQPPPAESAGQPPGDLADPPGQPEGDGAPPQERHAHGGGAPKPLDPRRCRARSKRSGEQCGRFATPGLKVCHYHGGSTPRAKAAAERNLAEDAAQRLLTEGIYGGLAGAEPVTDPVRALQQLAGLLGQMTESVGARVNELKALEAGEDLSKVRGQVALLDKLLGHFRAVLVDMNRLGIAQQRLALERDQAQLVGSGLIDGFHALALTAEQIESFMNAFRLRIRQQSAELGTVVHHANGVLSPVDNPENGGLS